MTPDAPIALAECAQTPWLQGLLVALSTFILEDPTTIGSGLLVADGKMAWQTAFFGLWFGIAAGDMLLYLLGRVLGPGVAALGLLSPDRIDKAEQWFNRNLFLAIVGSRFVPGMRTPTYVAAGLFKAHPVRFLLFAIGATLVWTVLLLTLTIQVGHAVFPLLGPWRWPIGIGLVLALIGGQWFYRARKLRAEAPATPAEPLVSLFEFWPPWLFYIPVGFYYAWLCLRHGSISLPSVSNPNIFTGGLIFESKTDILSQVGDTCQRWIAPYTHYDLPELEAPDAAAAEARLRHAGLDYPVVAKPDQGQRGASVKVVRTREQLAAYLAAFPRGRRVVLQALVPYEHEAGILYYRLPGEATGHIYSVTDKIFPKVVGDGVRTLRALMQADPRIHLLFRMYARRVEDRLDTVLPAGEVVPLVFAGNHAQGTIFRDGRALMTPALTARIEEIAQSVPELYFCRFDIRYADAASLQAGESFQIVEINGAGAEATHIWDARATLGEAYRTLFGQWRILFAIGAANRRRGFRPMGPFALLRACRAYANLSSQYTVSD